MRTLVAIIIVLLMAASACAAKPRPIVARVVVENGKMTSFGSGVLVASSGTEAVVLTNWHVVRPPRKSIIVRWPSGRKSAGAVVAADSTWDLAAVKVESPGETPVVIAAAAPRRGDRLTIAGYGGGEYREQAGPATGFASPVKLHDFRLVELRATARQGDSGGPIFNENGELAGVLYGVHDNVTVGPCCTRISGFLDEVGLLPAEGEK